MERDQLVADWHEQLVAAESEPVAQSPRRAWLARVRSRLYRFLLSLYGEGRWRAAGEPATPEAPGPRMDFVFDAPGADTFAGKPAKQPGKIRSVLKTVASSQDHRPPAGSLSGAEVIANRWLIVAAENANWDLPRCQNCLRWHGIDCRKVRYAGQWAIEVPSADHYQALQLLDERRDKLQNPPRVERQQVQLVRQAVSPLRAVMVLFAFPAGFCALVLALHVLAPNGRPTPEELQATGQAALGTAAICCVAMLGVWMQFRFLKRAEARTDAGRP